MGTDTTEEVFKNLNNTDNVILTRFLCQVLLIKFLLGFCEFRCFCFCYGNEIGLFKFSPMAMSVRRTSWRFLPVKFIVVTTSMHLTLSMMTLPPAAFAMAQEEI